ncbi:tripartite tricarboxylate transporter permease [Colwellia sp. MSW7]|uniref:Tripartite tricarboxylate transporter permease n=1 Tax=Colwellia maritima TaxID=2912588 RepID=A0ABS9X9H4_9GAMM|nr:tripartite tricarboxylate transporter permease [Colwellia maritima]MCI2285707.1 tripartite tricarboxylate transporter permease [Colwellia maritima]
MDSFTDIFTNITNGFGIAGTPENLMYGMIGVLLGTAVGVLPGLGPAVAISLLLPITFGMEPISAFIMFGGIYYGAMYGGAITAILVNTPGCSSSVVTTFDGHPLAKKGRAGTALLTAIIGSFIGGTFATAMLMLIAPALVELSLLFGPPEYFTLMLLALVLVATIGGTSLTKSLFSTFLGITIAMIGIDMQTGTARLTFGLPELYSGINIVLAGIGLFAVGESLWVLSGQDKKDNSQFDTTQTKLGMSSAEWIRSGFAWLRGTIIGFFAGILPGSGGTIAAFMAYGIEKKVSKHPKNFGHGAVEGVAAPEAANNAAAGGSMVPLLALGIPGSATTAVMLVAFQMYGLQPGPLLFQNSGDLVWGLIASLYIANILLVVINVPLVGLWSKLLKVPSGLLYSSVIVFSILGAYSLKGSISDTLIVFVLGLLAFTLRRFNFPIAPVLLGVVLGPLIEQEFRRSISISAGDFSIFFTRPITLTFLAIISVSILSTVIKHVQKRKAV